MAPRIRSNSLEDRTNRARLPVAKKPVFVRVGPKVSLGYRRTKTAGTWVARVANGKGANWTKRIGAADDLEEANGGTDADTAILTFWQAQGRAREVARAGQSGDGDTGKPLTVTGALDRYESDLRTRKADAGNVARVRTHLRDGKDKELPLASRPVALLTSRELGKWRDGLAKEMAPASVNRVATVLRAALNLAADGNDGITNRSAWDNGLKALPDATETRNVVLTEAEIRRVVAAAYRANEQFGTLVEVAGVTGARYSQIARLTVADVKATSLDIPTSRKGRGVKKIARKQVPVSDALAKSLRKIAANRPSDAILLLKPDGEPWSKSDQFRPWNDAAKQAGLERDATMNALRHSSITRSLKAGIPIRVVASLHDTSVAMIEKTYSVNIDKHVDDLVRPTILNLSPRRQGGRGKVVPFQKAAT